MSTPAAGVNATRRRWKVRTLTAVVVASLVVVAFLLFQNHDRERELALESCRAGKFVEAEPVLKQALNRHSDDVEVLDCLARGYFKAEKYLEAEPHLSKLIDLNPSKAEYLRLRMELYRHLKQREKAFADSQRLLDLDSTDTQLRRLAMGQAFSVGQFAIAEVHCRALLQEMPQDLALRSMLAEIRRARGDDEGAARILDDLIREDGRRLTAICWPVAFSTTIPENRERRSRCCVKCTTTIVPVGARAAPNWRRPWAELAIMLKRRR